MTARSRIEAIRQSVGLTAAEAALVREHGPRFASEVEEWVERFYARLVLDPTAMAILGDEARVLRLKRSLVAWFHEVFSMPLDDDYEVARRAIGRTHVRISMPQHLMVAAMGALQRDVAESVDRLLADDPVLAIRLRDALGKTLDLELALMLGAYAQELEEVRERRVREGDHPGLPQPPPEPPRAAETTRTLADIGRATATFAHEIRNPLASLAGAIDLLRQDLSDGERAEVGAMAQERLDHMRRLLDDTLRLARPVRGDPETVDLEAVVRSALDATRTDVAFAGIEVRVLSGPVPIRALGHAGPLRQAVMNLLLNAAEAQDGRGFIRVHLAQEAGCAVIRVEDEGPGIPAERREVVFDPFWTTKPKGTGLGLAFVRRVAEAAGGFATVEDTSRGACVRIVLPLAS